MHAQRVAKAIGQGSASAHAPQSNPIVPSGRGGGGGSETAEAGGEPLRTSVTTRSPQPPDVHGLLGCGFLPGVA